MASPYSPDALAAGLIGAMADGPDEMLVGSTTKTTSATTLVVTHGLSGTPDFIIATVRLAGGNILTPAITANSTSVTFTLNTANATWTANYILGYTA